MESRTININPVINPSAILINYLKEKCSLPQGHIERKLLNGEHFDTMKGEGADIDTKLIEEILS